jgi:hypothetical protein
VAWTPAAVSGSATATVLAEAVGLRAPEGYRVCSARNPALAAMTTRNGVPAVRLVGFGGWEAVAEVIAKAFRAGFQRMHHRVLPVPIDSGDESGDRP